MGVQDCDHMIRESGNQPIGEGSSIQQYDRPRHKARKWLTEEIGQPSLFEGQKCENLGQFDGSNLRGNTGAFAIKGESGGISKELEGGEVAIQ